MNYQKKLTDVIDYIGKNLDGDISLERLSDISCLSKFHFHRLFTAFTGISLLQYIRWQRLKRAAYQLIIDKDESIINIAINAGFESHEAFTRVFKKTCGLSPSQFRENADWSFWEEPPYDVQKRGNNTMKVDIRKVDEIRLAVVEHRGDPNLLPTTLNKLITWAKNQPMVLKPKPGEAFAFGYDDPQVTPAEKFRFDLALKVPNNLAIDNDGMIIEKHIPAGRYAVALHKGSHKNISDTIYYMYREWLSQSGEQLGDLPCVFCYYNFVHEVAETELLTEIWLLLK